MPKLWNEQEILSILRGFNPWWIGQALDAPKFHRLAFHICRQRLLDPAIRRAVLLSGPRRVGKTTILIQMAEALLQSLEARSIVYLSLDHPLLKTLPLPDILRIYHANIYQEGKPMVLLLDEVQYSADWELQLKQLIDHRKEIRILATGSASVVHAQGMIAAGVGRWIRVPIPTLSFYEFLQIRGEDTSSIPSDLSPLNLLALRAGEFASLAGRFRFALPLFQRYLLVGGFPETAIHPQIGFCQRLLREDVVERVLKRDMTALFGIRNVNDLEKLFIYICKHSGGILSVNACANALGITNATVSNHLEALKQSNLIYMLPPFSAAGKRVLKARYKVYLMDAALRNAVLLRGEEILSDPDEMGTIAETTILRHLVAYYYQDTPQIQYWRDSDTDKEVDMIVSSPKYVRPVEVKYREKAELSAKDGLVEFSRQQDVKHAYWVTRQETDFGIRKFAGMNTLFVKVPAHIFAYLLGQGERLLWLDKSPNP